MSESKNWRRPTTVSELYKLNKWWTSMCVASKPPDNLLTLPPLHEIEYKNLVRLSKKGGKLLITSNELKTMVENRSEDLFIKIPNGTLIYRGMDYVDAGLSGRPLYYSSLDVAHAYNRQGTSSNHVIKVYRFRHGTKLLILGGSNNFETIHSYLSSVFSKLEDIKDYQILKCIAFLTYPPQTIDKSFYKQCFKSFGMSVSKEGLQWKQTIIDDVVSLINRYTKYKLNSDDLIVILSSYATAVFKHDLVPARVSIRPLDQAFIKVLGMLLTRAAEAGAEPIDGVIYVRRSLAIDRQLRMQHVSDDIKQLASKPKLTKKEQQLVDRKIKETMVYVGDLINRDVYGNTAQVDVPTEISIFCPPKTLEAVAYIKNHDKKGVFAAKIDQLDNIKY